MFVRGADERCIGGAERHQRAVELSEGAVGVSTLGDVDETRADERAFGNRQMNQRHGADSLRALGGDNAPLEVDSLPLQRSPVVFGERVVNGSVLRLCRVVEMPDSALEELVTAACEQLLGAAIRVDELICIDVIEQYSRRSILDEEPKARFSRTQLAVRNISPRDVDRDADDHPPVLVIHDRALRQHRKHAAILARKMFPSLQRFHVIRHQTRKFAA